MKNLIIISKIVVLALLMSCKKEDITPKCYVVEWEKFVTYDTKLEVFSDTPSTVVTNGNYNLCDVTEKSIQELLSSLNFTTKGVGVCITIHTTIKQINK